MLKYTILSFIAYFSFINTNVLEAQSAQNSINAPGTFNFNTANSVDGNQTREEYDSDGDGTADAIYTYTYDANGNQTTQEYDNDGDGTVDEIYTYTYDANGNEAKEEYDGDGDGTAEYIVTYTYDVHGNQTREDRDFGGSNDGYQMSDNNTLDLNTNDFTFSAWFKTDDLAGSSYQTIFNKKPGGGGVTGFGQLAINNANDQIYIYHKGSGTG